MAGRLANLDDAIDLKRTAFIDTETTGLAGGTGTLAFLIGVGTFEEDDSFTLRQFFLRSPAEEPATLLHLAEWLDHYEAIVTFNGRGFDMPLLQTRFILHRLRPAILSMPNLDLLTPARRVWRSRLESCSLKSLEYHILDVHRDQDDIDGSLIPQIYFDYVRSGDAREMPRVMYHNAFDILSMVTLATRLIQIFDEDRTAPLTAADWYALGKWHADRDEHDQAERYLRQAVEDLADALIQQQAAMRLSLLYKQLDRRNEAIGLWEAVAQDPDAAFPRSLHRTGEILRMARQRSTAGVGVDGTGARADGLSARSSEAQRADHRTGTSAIETAEEKRACCVMKQKPRFKFERGFVADRVNLAEALLVIIHHLALQTILDGEHVAHGDDLTALLTHVLGRHRQSLGLFFGLLTGLSHLAAPSKSDLRLLNSWGYCPVRRR